MTISKLNQVSSLPLFFLACEPNLEVEAPLLEGRSWHKSHPIESGAYRGRHATSSLRTLLLKKLHGCIRTELVFMSSIASDLSSNVFTRRHLPSSNGAGVVDDRRDGGSASDEGGGASFATYLHVLLFWKLCLRSLPPSTQSLKAEGWAI